MNLTAFLTVFVGAGLGACLRYGLGLGLNPLFPAIPLGTLAANLLGALLAGGIAAWLLTRSDLPAAYRLFAITGFLGGLTTFSSYSLEVVALLQSGRNLLALGAASAHVVGSLALAWVGGWAVRSVLGH